MTLTFDTHSTSLTHFAKCFLHSYTMLHTKFQGHRSISSGEEDFLRFLPYMGMAAMLVM